MRLFLDFEKPIAELEGRIEDLKRLDGNETETGLNISEEVARLQKKAEKLLQDTYKKLSPWQKVQVARHPDRPHFEDIRKHMITDFIPLAGDRGFSEDHAIIGGLAKFRGISVMVIAHEKGRETEERLKHNFGMARPEGYRKAQRLMDMADRFNLPVLSFVDTPGAYPGVGAEQRGQAEAIARSIEKCLSIKVPFISTIIGEGGSGGAIALAASNTVFMLEHSVYSVISPEGCASILWRSADYAKDAAEALKMTANDLLELKIIDDVVTEPIGGAHRNVEKALKDLGDKIEKSLKELINYDGSQLKDHRRNKFLNMGRHFN